MRWVCLCCLLACVNSQVNVNFQIFSTNEDPPAASALSDSLSSYNLSQPLSMQLDVVYLNASIILGVCAPGFYWKVDTCFPCECPWHEPFDVSSVWFEPM